MKHNFALSIFAIATLFISGCYYDVEEELYPMSGNICDTSDVTYSLTVKPVIDMYCISCHSQEVQQGGVILETHASLLNYVNSGQLLGAIKHNPGFSAMPQGGAKLNNCTITRIEKWIQSGSLNN